MKKEKRSLISTLSILVLALSPNIANAGLILNAGESFEFEFNSLSEATLTTNPNGSITYARFDLSEGVDPGESLLFSVFEDSSSQLAIGSMLATNTEAFVSVNAGGLTTNTPPAIWQDFQGVLRVEMLAGSIELKSLMASTFVNGQFYQQTYAIPEPSSLALLMVGSAGGWLLRKRLRR